MPYVVRDKDGCVVSILASPAGDTSERLDASDAEIQAFFGKDEAARQLQEVLVASDLSFVRVLEDLIGVLLDKGVLMLTDLPEAAQEKIMQRRDIRSHLSALSDLIEDEADEEGIPL